MLRRYISGCRISEIPIPFLRRQVKLRLLLLFGVCRVRAYG